MLLPVVRSHNRCVHDVTGEQNSGSSVALAMSYRMLQRSDESGGGEGRSVGVAVGGVWQEVGSRVMLC